MPVKQSVTVWDDESQAKQSNKPHDSVIRWGSDLKSFAISKGMPKDADHYTRRNTANTGTIFEWEA